MGRADGAVNLSLYGHQRRPQPLDLGVPIRAGDM
jgi:hypothetical protein